MGYNSAKERLRITVKDELPHKPYTNGAKLMALLQYLEQVSRIHHSVSYKALKAYCERNYGISEHALTINLVITIINDMEMRRRQTLHLLEQYRLWLHDPYWRLFNGKPNRLKRKDQWQKVQQHISELWPVEMSRYPDYSN